MAENPNVLLDTTEGEILIELYPDKAPETVANFLKYVDEGFYKNTIFHRVIKGFMIQGGGLTMKMEEKPTSAPVKNEADNGLKNDRGTIAMARTMDPHSATAQFFINLVDNDFLNRMNDLIQQNFDNPDLNVNFLAEQLAISRSGLFAKIKTLADVTPNEMIQIVRLKRAAQLLRETNLSVSEVCYRVGFSSPSYFTKCFSKQFGIKPTEWKNGRGH